jgi:CRISPR/Cas system-associated endonuclease/helicase Cas3
MRPPEAIAGDAKKLREEKLEADRAAVELEKEEMKARQKMSMLSDLMNETDAKKRAQKLRKAQKALGGDVGGDEANFEAMAASMLSEEQTKMSAIEEKRKKAEEIQRRLQEAEAEFLAKQQAILAQRAVMEDKMSSAKKDIEEANKESATMQDELDASERGRGWATLDQITSMEGESEEETLKAMKQDDSFLGFCAANGLEIQEDVEGDVKV